MRNILVIEDEPELNDLLKEALTKAGFHVEQAFNGNEGLSKAMGSDFSVILLDLLLPVKSGFDFLYEYTFKKRKPSPVLVLSNLGDFGSQMKTYKKGVISYMVKANVSLKDVVSKVVSIAS